MGCQGCSWYCLLLSRADRSRTQGNGRKAIDICKFIALSVAPYICRPSFPARQPYFNHLYWHFVIRHIHLHPTGVICDWRLGCVLYLLFYIATFPNHGQVQGFALQTVLDRYKLGRYYRGTIARLTSKTTGKSHTRNTAVRSGTKYHSSIGKHNSERQCSTSIHSKHDTTHVSSRNLATAGQA